MLVLLKTLEANDGLYRLFNFLDSLLYLLPLHIDFLYQFLLYLLQF
jgi:hypothetical protein